MKAEKQDSGVLSRILLESEERAAALAARRSELSRAGRDAPRPPGFAAALAGPDVGIIAEVKRRSPSAGPIREGADAAKLARSYLNAGAAAISVLTEPLHFGGSLSDLAAVAALGGPALRKDFIVSELQLLEARAAGASAALLIVRALGARRLAALLRAASAAGLEALVEIHSEEELEIALASGAGIIGINARDLETLELAPALVTELLPRIPPGVIAVAESGIRSREDVERVAASGADAVLVGTHLAGAADPGSALHDLLGVRRHARTPVPR